VFSGAIKGGKLYIGEDCVLDANGISDREVYVGVRPEGFIPSESGKLVCEVSNVEVMGRDVSVVSKHTASLNPVIRSIVDADYKISAKDPTIKYELKPHKVFVFDKETEERIYFGDQKSLKEEF
jgi:multiple sugar transport system ATP-binding protein